jgi:uncharacterized protein YndB with AHSA1/START domain
MCRNFAPQSVCPIWISEKNSGSFWMARYCFIIGMEPNHYPPLNIKCHFATSAEKVFAAWTVPAIANLWLFKSRFNKVELINDTTEGGMFSVKQWEDGIQSEGKMIDHFGKYIQVHNPSKLVFTLEVPDHFQGISKVTLHISTRNNGAVMNFMQEGIDTSITKKPWKQMFKNLQRILNTL